MYCLIGFTLYFSNSLDWNQKTKSKIKNKVESSVAEWKVHMNKAHLYFKLDWFYISILLETQKLTCRVLFWQSWSTNYGFLQQRFMSDLITNDDKNRGGQSINH